MLPSFPLPKILWTCRHLFTTLSNKSYGVTCSSKHNNGEIALEYLNNNIYSTANENIREVFEMTVNATVFFALIKTVVGGCTAHQT